MEVGFMPVNSGTVASKASESGRQEDINAARETSSPNRSDRPGRRGKANEIKDTHERGNVSGKTVRREHNKRMLRQIVNLMSEDLDAFSEDVEEITELTEGDSADSAVENAENTETEARPEVPIERDEAKPDEAAETLDETAKESTETTETPDETAETAEKTSEIDETAETPEETAETAETTEETAETAEMPDETAETPDETAEASAKTAEKTVKTPAETAEKSTVAQEIPAGTDDRKSVQGNTSEHRNNAEYPEIAREVRQFLSDALDSQPDYEMKYNFRMLLKSLSPEMGKEQLLEFVSQNLRFLSERTHNKGIAADLAAFSKQFAAVPSESELSVLKQKVLELLGRLNTSDDIQFAKLETMTLYSLLRMEDNGNFIREAMLSLGVLLEGGDLKTEIAAGVSKFIKGGIDVADMLKITTPLINKGPINPARQITDPSAPAFDLTQIDKVLPMNISSGILSQHHGLVDKDGKPTILMDLLKDPAVTVSFLKNIYMLQEIISLLPVNNSTFTEEIEKLFNALLIPPGNIAGEMKNQENKATAFKGELFDFLRNIVRNNPDKETKYCVAMLLKSINHEMNRRDILDALANNLKFLGESLSASAVLAGKLEDISEAFRAPGAEHNFTALKSEVLELLGEVENSILFDSKADKLVSITQYNLSRFNDNRDFLKESLRTLVMFLDGADTKNELISQVNKFMRALRAGALRPQSTSEVMDVLADIIGKQSENEEVRMLNAEHVEKIVTSLLSSPCNFTPLLHFVIPVMFDSIKSFAELWINPDGKEDSSETGDSDECIHMLIVFNMEGIGQFETELYVENRNIKMFLFCPQNYVSAFSGLQQEFSDAISFSDYRFEKIKVDKLEDTRSLLQVFKSLPYKRMGVDVKI
ncbi:MAG: hypothetical protein LBR54_00640 [Oscillospiraceae bacterium]|jgi:hypothetical protein|nr:hypothetical protein [Oscillospiraceae bacterium]